MALKRITPSRRRLLAPHILVLKQAFKEPDPTVLPDAVIDFFDWCVHTQEISIDQVQPDALLTYATSMYVGQVKNGGHGQFAGNTDMDPGFLSAVDAGLSAMGMYDLHSIFLRFIDTMAADDELHEEVVDGCGFGDVPEVIKALDDAFLSCPGVDQFSKRTAEWLRANPNVLALTPAEKHALEKEIVARMAPPSGPLAVMAARIRTFAGQRSGHRPPITTHAEFNAECEM